MVLSYCCTCGEKTLISRLNLCPSATCRGLRPCLLWHLWPVSASALQTRKPSPNTIGPPTFARLCVTASLNAISRPKGYILIISMQRDAYYGYRLQMLLLCRRCLVTCCMTLVCRMLTMCLRLVTGSPGAFNLQIYASFCS